ncbi:MAG TPA: hypothetical protein VKQ31_09845, partial [Steroidobacteraceae bacterium]|nr:hypothetical protein [Steroidobacteraceae bacterium]
DRGRLLALDTPAGLKRKAPGGTLIELTLNGEAAPLVDPARALPGVLRAEAERMILRVYHPDGGQAIAALIGAASARELQVTNIHIAPPSLETLFVSLTGRKLD